MLNQVSVSMLVMLRSLIMKTCKRVNSTKVLPCDQTYVISCISLKCVSRIFANDHDLHFLYTCEVAVNESMDGEFLTSLPQDVAPVAVTSAKKVPVSNPRPTLALVDMVNSMSKSMN